MILKTTQKSKTWLKVIRPPRMKVLRAHLFGLTLGLTTLLAHLVFALPEQRNLILLVEWFAIGYLAGAFFCLLYNFLVYAFLKHIHPEWFQLWFWYNPAEIVNIVKTPVPQKDWDDHSRRLYNDEPFKVFNFDPYDGVKSPQGREMENPYTIVFVANPFMRLREQKNGKVMAQRDPIMDDIGLFLKAIYRALFSFEFNEMIGRPDLFSKIRVVAVNEAEALLSDSGKPVDYELVKDQCYVREFLGQLEIDSGDGVPLETFAHRMLVPNVHTREKISRLVREKTKNRIRHIDVIFALSASPTHDISSARLAIKDTKTQDPQEGKAFTFSIDPYCEKGDDIARSEAEKARCATPPSRDLSMLHEYFPPENGMGLAALSAYDVRNKLPLHEFAHAMSSVSHGMIVDEYYDYLVIREPSGEEDDQTGGVEINRVYRNPDKMDTTHHVPVHKHFARYNGFVYESDRDHHIAAQGWRSYFPSRQNPEVRCTMEVTEDVFQFDELLTDFIYDRLWVKVNRDFLMP